MLQRLPTQGERQLAILDNLIQDKGLRPGQYALFFLSGEGVCLPIGPADQSVEETSGFVVDNQERVFSFWLGWDEVGRRPALLEWEQVDPEPGWSQSAEYRAARQMIGLHAA